MKKLNILSGSLLRIIFPAIALGVMINLSSCTKTETNKPAPTLTVNPTTASNIAGAVVTSSVHVDAPEGGKTLTFLVNGTTNATLPNVTLSGTAQDVPISFTIPASATVGSTYAISAQATDNKNQVSIAGFFTVTVTNVAPKQLVQVPAGNLTGTVNWTKDKIYVLNGFVRVGKDEKPTAGKVEPVIVSTATLNIEAGTVIYGKTGTPGGTLIVQRGSTINAVGTAAAPIIFTSEKPVGQKKSGDWGGVVLCGKAKNNFINGAAGNLQSASTGVDGVEELEGGYGGFHGGGGAVAQNDADNSGTLKYVRIEFAGYPINPNQEINGLTLGSVGSGTTLSYIQVTYANDDSFEWFGGAVNADHLIAYKGIDDDFDTDNGFSGKVQFGLGIRDASIADQSGSNGFESDNNANGYDLDPKTTAQFSNMTIVGGKATSGTTINLQFQNGAQIRRNSEMDIYNSLITAYPNGIFLDGGLPANNTTPGLSGTVVKANSGSVVLRANIIAGVDSWGGNGYGSASTSGERAAITTNFPFGADANHPNNPRGRLIASGAGSFVNGVFTYNPAAASPPPPAAVEQPINGQPSAPQWVKSVDGVATSNTLLPRWTDSGLNANVFEPLLGAPTLVASGLLASGADFTGLTGFTVVTHRGAFGSTDWTLGWVNWNPQQKDYSF